MLQERNSCPSSIDGSMLLSCANSSMTRSMPREAVLSATSTTSTSSLSNGSAARYPILTFFRTRRGRAQGYGVHQSSKTTARLYSRPTRFLRACTSIYELCAIIADFTLQDADLIMLALATHEPDFRILREDPQEKRESRCSICHEFGHSSKQCGSKFRNCIEQDYTVLIFPCRD